MPRDKGRENKRPLIISASRRTDIPAFYADWFMNRVRAGHCLVANPFNAHQVSRISLNPEEVDAIVFWSKNPRPMLRHMPLLDRMGYLSYFLYTLLDYPKYLEPHVPPLEQRIETFRLLAGMLGPQRVVWRYDPIIISSATPYGFHKDRFELLAHALRGATRRVIVSIVDFYHKTNRRLAPLEDQAMVFHRDAATRPEMKTLLGSMAEIARANEMQIQSCAEAEDYSNVGVPPGACIDAHLIRRLGGNVPATKDPGQRDQCLCTLSRDIGVTDTCLHGCVYCYATRSHTLALRRHAEHDPKAPILWTKPTEPTT